VPGHTSALPKPLPPATVPLAGRKVFTCKTLFTLPTLLHNQRLRAARMPPTTIIAEQDLGRFVAKPQRNTENGALEDHCKNAQ